MKKYLVLLLSLVLLIPTVVRADAITISVSTNRRVVVGGYYEVTVGINGFDLKNRTINEMVFTYDTDKLSISKSDIIVSVCGQDVLSDPKANKDGLVVDISNGKVKIEAKKSIGSSECVQLGDNPSNQLIAVHLEFKALKAGEAMVELDAGYSLGGGPVEDMNLSVEVEDSGIKCPEQTVTDCIPAEEEPKEPQTTDQPKEEAKPTTEETVKEEKNDNLLLYISLGANAVLFLGLILALVLKKKPEPVIAPAPVVEPVPTPVEPTPTEEVPEQPTDLNN